MKNRKKLKLTRKGHWKFYQNDRGQYIVGVNAGSPFVIPCISRPKVIRDIIYYIPDNGVEKDKTRFIIISDGSYKGASIIDLDNMYIIYESEHNNTNIKNHSILERQIELNACFFSSEPTLIKEVVKNEGILRIFRVGRIAFENKFVYANSFTTNKDYYPSIDEFDFRSKSPNHNIFIEFLQKEKCYIIRNWYKIEFI